MWARIITLVALCIAPLGCGGETAESKPEVREVQSVILIGVDTLRADHLGLYGAKRKTSPFLDEFAKGGRIFEHAYATSSWTLPSFASLLTGLDPAEHGAGILLRHAEEGTISKDRLGQKKRTKMYADVATLAERLSAAGYQTSAVVQTPNLDPAYGVDRGFDSYDMSRDGGRSRRAGAAVTRALELISRNKKKPFFLFLHLIDPHLSYDAPKPFAGRFTKQVDTPFKMSGKNILKLRKAYPGYEAVKKEYISAAYDEEIASTDHQLARLFKELEKRGLADDTLIILTSDHGEEFFEHGSFEHGHSMYREVLHVPFVVWGPGVVAGRESLPVSVADAAPTILEAVGIDAPNSGYGQSLWPLLTGSHPPKQDRLIVAAGTLYGPDQRMALRWPYKVIFHPASGAQMLFNLEDDPDEKNDLSETHAELAQQLVAELNQRLQFSDHGTKGEEAILDDQMIKELRELGYVE
jgi:arylsulfatase A-like enzyme